MSHEYNTAKGSAQSKAVIGRMQLKGADGSSAAIGKDAYRYVQRHHLIPQSLADQHSWIKESGFNIHAKSNWIPLPSQKGARDLGIQYRPIHQGHCADHKAFDKHVESKLNQMAAQRQGWTPQQTKLALEKLSSDIRSGFAKQAAEAKAAHQQGLPFTRPSMARAFDPKYFGGGKAPTPTDPTDAAKSRQHFNAINNKHTSSAMQDFEHTLLSTGLLKSYNSLNSQRPCMPWAAAAAEANKGLQGEIGGVAVQSGLLQGHRNSLAELTEGLHFITLESGIRIDGEASSSNSFPCTNDELRALIRELVVGIYAFDSFPFFSLHFNTSADLYPVLHPCYQGTFVGQIIGMLDYQMKGFLNGGFYDSEEWMHQWAAKRVKQQQSHSSSGSSGSGSSSNSSSSAYVVASDSELKSHLLDVKLLCQTQWSDLGVEYKSLRERLFECGLEGPLAALKAKQQAEADTAAAAANSRSDAAESTFDFNSMPTMKFRTSFRIIARENSIRKAGNAFLIDSGFDVKYSIETSAEYEEYLQQHRRLHGKEPTEYELVKKVYAQAANDIQEIMPQLPPCKKYFKLLSLISFLSHYLNTLKQSHLMPVLHETATSSFIRGFPAVAPHLPVRSYRSVHASATVEQIAQYGRAHPEMQFNKTLDYFKAVILEGALGQAATEATSGVADAANTSHGERLAALVPVDGILSKLILQQLPPELQSSYQSYLQPKKSNSSKSSSKLGSSIKSISQINLKYVLEFWEILESQLVQQRVELLMSTLFAASNTLCRLPQKHLAQIFSGLNLPQRPVIHTLYRSAVEKFTDQIKSAKDGASSAAEEKKEEDSMQQKFESYKQELLTFAQEHLLSTLSLTKLRSNIVQVVQQGAELLKNEQDQVLQQLNSANSDLLPQLAEINKLLASKNALLQEIYEALVKERDRAQARAADQGFFSKMFNSKPQEEAKKMKYVCEKFFSSDSQVVAIRDQIYNSRLQELKGKKQQLLTAMQQAVAAQKQAIDKQAAEDVTKLQEIQTNMSNCAMAVLTADKIKLEDVIARIAAQNLESALQQRNQLEMNRTVAHGDGTDSSLTSKLGELVSRVLSLGGNDAQFGSWQLSTLDTQVDPNAQGDHQRVFGGCAVTMKDMQVSPVLDGETLHRKLAEAFVKMSSGIELPMQTWFDCTLPWHGNSARMLSFGIPLKNFTTQDIDSLTHAANQRIQDVVECKEVTAVIAKASDVQSAPEYEEPDANSSSSSSAPGLPALSASLLHAQNRNGVTALMEAAKVGNWPLMQQLQQQGVDINRQCPNGQSALTLLVQAGHSEAAVSFISTCTAKGLLLNQQLDSGNTALHLSLTTNQTTVWKQLVQSGADVTVKRYSDGYTAVHLAASIGCNDFLLQLPSLSVHANLALPSKKTPLHLAAAGGFVDVIELLLKHSADAGAQMYDGRTPLMLALEHGHVDAAAVIMQRAATRCHVIPIPQPSVSVSTVGNTTTTTTTPPKEQFVLAGPTGAAKEAGGKAIFVNYLKQSATMFAFMHGMFDIGLHLWRLSNEDVYRQDRVGSSLFSCVLEQGSAHMFRRLLELQAPPKSFVESIPSLLEAALKRRHVDLADALLDRAMLAAGSSAAKQSQGAFLLSLSPALPRMAVQANAVGLLGQMLEHIQATHPGNTLVSELVTFVTQSGMTKPKTAASTASSNSTKPKAHLPTAAAASTAASSAVVIPPSLNNNLLWSAAENGSFECLQLLLTCLESVTSLKPLFQCTPSVHLLWAAVLGRDRRVLEMVLKHSDVNASIDADGNTVAHAAVTVGAHRLLSFLQRRSAKLTKENKLGMTIGDVAVQLDEVDSLKTVLACWKEDIYRQHASQVSAAQQQLSLLCFSLLLHARVKGAKDVLLWMSSHKDFNLALGWMQQLMSHAGNSGASSSSSSAAASGIVAEVQPNCTKIIQALAGNRGASSWHLCHSAEEWEALLAGRVLLAVIRNMPMKDILATCQMCIANDHPLLLQTLLDTSSLPNNLSDGDADGLLKQAHAHKDMTIIQTLLSHPRISTPKPNPLQKLKPDTQAPPTVRQQLQDMIAERDAQLKPVRDAVQNRLQLLDELSASATASVLGSLGSVASMDIPRLFRLSWLMRDTNNMAKCVAISPQQCLTALDERSMPITFWFSRTPAEMVKELEQLCGWFTADQLQQLLTMPVYPSMPYMADHFHNGLHLFGVHGLLLLTPLALRTALLSAKPKCKAVLTAALNALGARLPLFEVKQDILSQLQQKVETMKLRAASSASSSSSSSSSSTSAAAAAALGMEDVELDFGAFSIGKVRDTTAAVSKLEHCEVASVVNLPQYLFDGTSVQLALQLEVYSWLNEWFQPKDTDVDPDATAAITGFFQKMFQSKTVSAPGKLIPNSAILPRMRNALSVVAPGQRKSCLSAAIAAKSLSSVKILLRQGADTHCTDFNARTPLHHAALLSVDAGLLLLPHCGGLIDKPDEDGNTALALICASPEDDAVMLLRRMITSLGLGMSSMADGVDAGMCSLISNTAGQTALHLAASRGNTDRVEVLLSAGVDVNLRTTRKMETAESNEQVTDADDDPRVPAGLSPLHLACRAGHLSTVTCLLSRGADAFSKDERGNTPLDMAFQGGQSHIIRLLQNIMPNMTSAEESMLAVDESDGAGPSAAVARPTPVIAVVGGDRADLLPLLSSSLEAHGLPFSLTSMLEHNITVLHLAAMLDRTKLIPQLLEAGIKSDAVTSSTMQSVTALHLAAQREHALFARQLLQCVSPNPKQLHSLMDCRDLQGRTALYFACESLSVPMVLSLIAYEAKINVASLDNTMPAVAALFAAAHTHHRLDEQTLAFFDLLVVYGDSSLTKAAQADSPVQQRIAAMDPAARHIANTVLSRVSSFQFPSSSGKTMAEFRLAKAVAIHQTSPLVLRWLLTLPCFSTSALSQVAVSAKNLLQPVVSAEILTRQFATETPAEWKSAAKPAGAVAPDDLSSAAAVSAASTSVHSSGHFLVGYPLLDDWLVSVLGPEYDTLMEMEAFNGLSCLDVYCQLLAFRWSPQMLLPIQPLVKLLLTTLSHAESDMLWKWLFAFLQPYHTEQPCVSPAMLISCLDTFTQFVLAVTQSGGTALDHLCLPPSRLSYETENGRLCMAWCTHVMTKCLPQCRSLQASLLYTLFPIQSQLTASQMQVRMDGMLQQVGFVHGGYLTSKYLLMSTEAGSKMELVEDTHSMVADALILRLSSMKELPIGCGVMLQIVSSACANLGLPHLSMLSHDTRTTLFGLLLHKLVRIVTPVQGAPLSEMLLEQCKVLFNDWKVIVSLSGSVSGTYGSSNLSQLLTLKNDSVGVFSLKLIADSMSVIMTMADQLKITELDKMIRSAGTVNKLSQTLFDQQASLFEKKYPERNLQSVVDDFKQSVLVSHPLPALELERVVSIFKLIDVAKANTATMSGSVLVEQCKKAATQIAAQRAAAVASKQPLDVASSAVREQHALLFSALRQLIRLHYHIFPYSSQMLTLLSLVLYPASESHRGRLAQVRTGEGKSPIVALNALYWALQHRTVDVITTARYLSIRDYWKYRDFFLLFGVSSSHVCTDSPSKESFSGQIIYGTNYDFEFSLLRDGLYHMEMRYSPDISKAAGASTVSLIRRSCDVVIIDEVDSLFLDSAFNAARIAIPQVVQMQWVYPLVYAFAKKRFPPPSEEELAVQNEKKEAQSAAASLQQDASDESDDESDVQLSEVTAADCESVLASFNAFIASISNTSDAANTRRWVQDTVQANNCRLLRQWIVNACKAARLIPGRDYVVIHTKENNNGSGAARPSVVIADYANTGRLQLSSRWQKGLHEMVEVREGLQPQNESLTAASLSHPAFFGKYRVLQGLTGTIGEEQEREELMRVYAVDTFDVPTYLPCIRTQLDPIVCSSPQAYYEAIRQEVEDMEQKGRPVLVILNSIGESDALFNFLANGRTGAAQTQSTQTTPSASSSSASSSSSAAAALALLSLTRSNSSGSSSRPSDSGSQAPTTTVGVGYRLQLLNELQRESEAYVVTRAGEPGMVTIATNAAGRGTDIILHPTARTNGGLHVIVGFYPTNSRVEMQALGRAGRQGQPGSTRIIVHSQLDTVAPYSFIMHNPQIAAMLFGFSGSSASTSSLTIQAMNHMRTLRVKHMSARRGGASLLEVIKYAAQERVFSAIDCSVEVLKSKRHLLLSEDSLKPMSDAQLAEQLRRFMDVSGTSQLRKDALRMQAKASSSSSSSYSSSSSSSVSPSVWLSSFEHDFLHSLQVWWAQQFTNQIDDYNAESDEEEEEETNQGTHMQERRTMRNHRSSLDRSPVAQFCHHFDRLMETSFGGALHMLAFGMSLHADASDSAASALSAIPGINREQLNHSLFDLMQLCVRALRLPE